MGKQTSLSHVTNHDSPDPEPDRDRANAETGAERSSGVGVLAQRARLVPAMSSSVVESRLPSSSSCQEGKSTTTSPPPAVSTAAALAPSTPPRPRPRPIMSGSGDEQTHHVDDVDKLKDTLGRTLSRSMKPPPLPHAHHLPLHPAPPLSPHRIPEDRRVRRPPSRVNSIGPGVFGDYRAMALSDTPAGTAPNSPKMLPRRQNSGSSTPRIRPTTLDIPGLTKSKASPDGRIAKRDVGAKLVIIMVGLPARGKSYITKKLARYLNWLQHDTRIFNVGERRRVAAGGLQSAPPVKAAKSTQSTHPLQAIQNLAPTEPVKALLAQQTSSPSPSTIATTEPTKLMPAAHITVNGVEVAPTSDENDAYQMPEPEPMDQSAAFFDPSNTKAALIREQCAIDTLSDLLDFVLDGNGSVGIMDATNSTLERRKLIMRKIRERAGPELNVLFLESRCVDEGLLESNMRLKLSGPDYKDKDPVKALEDFKKRVAIYEKNYVPLGDYEEANNMAYISMIDVGRKVISHQIRGFLSAQANYYLLNFNLAPRQIWITRHGLSIDNVLGKIGGDSDLCPEGIQFAQALTRFVNAQRQEWDMRQLHKLRNSHFPPQPGDTTPPNPHYQAESGAAGGHGSGSVDENNANATDDEPPQKAFCVWTSMLKRSIQTARFFDDEEYDTKQMRMLDELNAGVMEGLTYKNIAADFPAEYEMRKRDKLHYRYPGPGGEGYLDIINRLRPVIVELERMEDHVLLVAHRSVARVLLAYFRGLGREEVAELDVPIGTLYCLEPRPYGVEFRVFTWHRETQWFHERPNFEMKRAVDDMQ